MLALIQRVNEAEVWIDDQCHARIDQGILALMGIERDDQEPQARQLIDKIMTYRIFSDQAGRMNLDLTQVAGSLLLVSQFTLAAKTNSGRRPGFESAMAPDRAKPLYDAMVHYATSRYPKVLSGVFGAYMRIKLENDGPVTFILRAAND